MSNQAEITIFLSYARADDRIYQMVKPFKELLGHFVYAKSGRKVKTFLDQDSIGWGEIWRDRLEAEILGASIFIPLLSASYLDSENCRMEFNRFQANATSLGVKELLLPVLLLNAPAIFNEDSTDDVVREAAARQWEVIEDAVLADPGSSAWKTTMARLADRFVASLEVAESTLEDLDQVDLTGLPSDDDEDEEEDDENNPGLAELMESMSADIDELTTVATELNPAMMSLGESASAAGTLSPNPTANEVKKWSLTAASAFEQPSIEIGDLGERMLIAAKKLDLDMQRLRRHALTFMQLNPDLAQSYNSIIDQISGLDNVGEQLDGLLTIMRPAEQFSVPLRKALRPARRGLTRVMDSIGLIQSWQPINFPDKR